MIYDRPTMAKRKSLRELYLENPYRNIFITIMVVIGIDALAPNEGARSAFADLMLSVVLVAALVETVRAGRRAVVALVLGVPAIALRIVSIFAGDSMAISTAVLTITIMFLGFLIWNLLHDVSKGERSTSERIFGALCAYIFIGLLFAALYTHLEFRQPGTFSTSQALATEGGVPESELFPLFTYFSFVTLTTLGYGDISPVAEHARTLAWLEALLGQLYLAVMVAGFVGRHISESLKEKDGNPPPDL